MRDRAVCAAAVAAVAAMVAGCGGGGGVITVAGVATPQTGARAAFHVPAGATVVHAGPGPLRTTVARAGYRLRIVLRPNRATGRNRVTVTVLRHDRPVPGTAVRLDAGMLDMAMGVASYPLGSGRDHRAVLPVWAMPGRWGLGFTVTPPGRSPIHVVVDDELSR